MTASEWIARAATAQAGKTTHGGKRAALRSTTVQRFHPTKRFPVAITSSLDDQINRYLQASFTPAEVHARRLFGIRMAGYGIESQDRCHRCTSIGGRPRLHSRRAHPAEWRAAVQEGHPELAFFRVGGVYFGFV